MPNKKQLKKMLSQMKSDHLDHGSESDDNTTDFVALKRAKANAKSALTKSRNRLLELLKEKDKNNESTRNAIHESIDRVLSIQTEAIDSIVVLSEAYKKSGNKDSFDKTCSELDQVVVDTSEIIQTAERFLKQAVSDSIDLMTPSANSPNSPKSAKSAKSAVNTSSKLSTHSGSDDDYDLGTDMWRQLKRVSIPVFDGSIKKYEGWKAAFLACVDKAPATKEYKLLQLKQYLSGEAAELVEKLGHNAAAYDIALERLDRKYGGKRRQIALQLDEIKNFKSIRDGSPRDIDRFADMLDVAVVNLRQNDKEQELGDGCLYSLLLTKMTETMILQYQRWIIDTEKEESVENLRIWVLQEAKLQTIAHESKHGFSKLGKSGSFFSKTDESRLTCSMCSSTGHSCSSCPELIHLSISERWSRAKERGLCFRCLGHGHIGRSCKLLSVCGVNGCVKTHNSALHFDIDTSVSDKTVDESSLSSYTAQLHYAALRTVPVVLKHGTRRLTVNALLDDASTETYVNEDVVSQLGISGSHIKVSVNVLNSRTETFDSMSVNIGLESIDGKIDTNITARTTSRVTGQMSAVNWNHCSSKWNHLKDISFPSPASPRVIDILIGMDHLDLHSCQKQIAGKPGEPVARLTPLGWTCVGNIPSLGIQSSSSSAFYTANENTRLDDLLQTMWELDDVSTGKTVFTQDEQLAVDSVVDSLQYCNGRYKVGIPWKSENTLLPDSYDMALNRLKSTEKKLSKDETIANAYNDVIDQYQQKGYIRKVSVTEQSDSQWYLPHFPVVKMDRASTKVRIVFDASAKVKDVSLNDVIHQGPKLQNDLFAILLRFRQNPVAVICDVAEMYMQIEILERDRPYFRFLWRTDPNKPPEVYEFSRLVFGINASPFLAQYVTQEHAKSQATMFPLASETVAKSTYMDDNIASVDTSDTGVDLYNQLKDLWSLAGMHVRKWLSNSLHVLENIPTEDRLGEFSIHQTELPSVKALGLMWDAEKDEFRISKRNSDTCLKMTKRTFLREMASVFDPLGLLAPFLVRAKVLLQKMWLLGLGWDQTLSPDVERMVSLWLQEIPNLASVSFPRTIRPSYEDRVEHIHVFVDASEEAYGSVIYSVSVSKSGAASSHIVTAKNRVAPLKATSIPRLELQAAVLGVKLAVVVMESLQLDPHMITYWSDSFDVLWWIRNQSRTFKPFVANRIGFIHERSVPSQWKHVPSALNPADLITRGTDVFTLNEQMWQGGPDFIKMGESHWPKQGPLTSSTETTEKKASFQNIDLTFMTQLSTSPWRLEPNRFSDWTRFCRVTSWVLRFINNIRSSNEKRQTGELSASELADAEAFILADTQRQAFQSEYSALAQGKSIPPSSKLLNLLPFLDNDGLLRCSGRLRLSTELAYDARFPIILPRKNWVTQLLVKRYHERCLHMGTNHTLSAISSKFWIISAREEIRCWEHECSLCKRRKAKTATQLMSNLPEARVKRSARAFQKVGVDFAGPFLTVQGRGKSRRKRYLCLFTCLATRAVHLEMAFGLDTDSFLNAFFRMSHRRGMPQEILSDNGTNFVGASKELRTFISHQGNDDVKSTLASKDVIWKFNPPHAPHFGGVFESLVKSAKRAIVAILGAGDITDEELMSAFIGAESLLNSRPLTYQSAHPADIIPLTPNHFLHGQCGGDFAPEIDDSHNPRKRWRRVQELIRHFWKRWLKEWLPSLNARKKWFKVSRDLRIGDVVLVVDPNTSRGTWPLGKVVKTHPGKDGFVRVVDLKIRDQIFTRPITRVCPLELNAEQAS